MRIILDTNVILAAFAGRGLAHALFELCLEKHEIIISEHILSEVQRNLQKKIKMPKDKVLMITEYLKEYCKVSDYKRLDNEACRDIDDVKILGLSEVVKPDYIITGDKDLLVLKKFHSVPIITPREFWEISKSKRT
ncbi:MAG: putative toxin-antitoxin system toxin component, PIN family [Deltaproteobacteria bacterium RBG_13_47_9]|nr:MAG: putative toxin-antitoxin system toxin component, PIN family [Deltaproteobacteria bacterium RBG_13_47_9]